jgi:PleD family two-component response regulator
MASILFAEDDAAMREMVRDTLRSAGHEIRTVADGTAALDRVREAPPDLVLLDYRIGDPDGLEVCRRIKGDPRLEHLPVLILTAESHVEQRIQGFAAGANDYLAKPFDSRELIARVEALLRLSEQGRERNPTSGLPGGTAIERELQRRRELGEPFTLAYLDLDYFKPFNDHFGFATANAVIEDVGELMRERATGDRFAGHVGGDDFVVISGTSDARAFTEEIQRAFDERLARRVPAEVTRSGSYRGMLRDGEEATDVPLTRLTAALLHLKPARMPTLAELGKLAADAKRRAKSAEPAGIVEVDASG